MKELWRRWRGSRWRWHWLIAARVLLGLIGGVTYYLLGYHRDLTEYDALWLPAARSRGTTQRSPAEQPSAATPAHSPAETRASSDLRVTWLGVATLLFDDGESALMTDGFFTRPRLWQLLSIAPDPHTIDNVLSRLPVRSLAAVIPIHSHYDHVLDSPIVAQKTGALLVGSTSSANVARGYGLPNERIRVVSDGETLQFGRFSVTFVLSEHSPGNRFPGVIDAPIHTPARSNAFRSGDCYSLLIEHAGHSILVHGSAGFIPGKLAGKHADVVYLGVGNLGKQSHEYRVSYWREVVQRVGARRVIPIHWDDFFAPLTQPLGSLPAAIDDFDETMTDLAAFAKRDRVDLRLSREWVASDPFER